jgi:hypothetical protein
MKQACIGLVAAAAAVTFTVPASAQLRLPSLPHVSTQRLAMDAASKRMAQYMASQEPVVLDWSAVYPAYPQLPGSPFHAEPARNRAALSSIVRQLAGSSGGSVRLAPGDYDIPIRVYCSRVHAHMPVKVPEVYVVGPLRGTRRDVLVAMYSKVTGAHATYRQVQPLEWSIETGMRYTQLPAEQRNLFDRLIPGYRSSIAGNFLEQLADQWTHLPIPGLPSFDSAINELGAVGQTYRDLQQAQSQIVNNSSDFDSLFAQLTPPLDVSDRGANFQTSPWGQVSPNVYMHTPSTGGTGQLFDLQVRVTGTQAQDVPLLSQILYPTYCSGCQPLTYNVETNAPPKDDENGGGGMPD